ncbi:hypothetical protein MOSE0_M04742 [Monosporozyma servazzii]
MAEIQGGRPPSFLRPIVLRLYPSTPHLLGSRPSCVPVIPFGLQHFLVKIRYTTFNDIRHEDTSNQDELLKHKKAHNNILTF